MQKVTGRQWWSAALTGRMIALFILLTVAAVIAVRLGAWQLDRAAIRGAEEARQIEASRLAADPVPLEDALRVGEVISSEHKLVKAEVTGEWGAQLLVPDREIDGEPAFLVLNELRLTDGPDEGAMIPVLRGWIATSDVEAAGGALGVPAPSGSVTLIGFIHEDEKAASGAYPPGEVGAISVGQLLNVWGGPTFTGYLVAVEAEGGGVLTVPAPSYTDGAGVNVRNLLYAGEWFLFGGFALFLWWRMVRDEAAHLLEDELLAESEAAAAHTEGARADADERYTPDA